MHNISYDDEDGTMHVTVRGYNGGARDWVEYLKDNGLNIQPEAEGLLARLSRGVTVGTSYDFVVLTTDLAPSSHYSVTTGFLHQRASLLGGSPLRVESSLVLLDVVAQGGFDRVMPYVLVLTHEPIYVRWGDHRLGGQDQRLIIENSGWGPTLDVTKGGYNVSWSRGDDAELFFPYESRTKLFSY